MNTRLRRLLRAQHEPEGAQCNKWQACCAQHAPQACYPPAGAPGGSPGGPPEATPRVGAAGGQKVRYMRESMPENRLTRVRLYALKRLLGCGERKKVPHFYFSPPAKKTRAIFFKTMKNGARHEKRVALHAKTQFQSKCCASATAQQLNNALIHM